MITTKFKFCKFRHTLSPNQRLQSKQISMPLKKAKCYLDVLLDQDDCRVNFAVSINLTKNLLVKFRFEATKFFVLLSFLVKFNESRAINQLHYR